MRFKKGQLFHVQMSINKRVHYCMHLCTFRCTIIQEVIINVYDLSACRLHTLGKQENHGEDVFCFESLVSFCTHVRIFDEKMCLLQLEEMLAKTSLLADIAFHLKRLGKISVVPSR